MVDGVRGRVEMKGVLGNGEGEVLSGRMGNVMVEKGKREGVRIGMRGRVEVEEKIMG